jgi:hypothetical protein
LQKELPAKIAKRRSKLGFSTPQDGWLCGPMKPALERWLGQDRPVWTYVHQKDVRKLAELTWKVNGSYEEPGLALFRIFVFDRWLEIFGTCNSGDVSPAWTGAAGPEILAV